MEIGSLDVARIGLYSLHRVDPEAPSEESLGAIETYVDEGRIAHVGISAVTVEQIERARRAVPIAAVQNHYNLSERKHEAVDDAAGSGDAVPGPPAREHAGAGSRAQRRGAGCTAVGKTVTASPPRLSPRPAAASRPAGAPRRG